MIFTLCKSCAELKRSAFSHISRETYAIFDTAEFVEFMVRGEGTSTSEIKQRIGAVMARYASGGHFVPLTFERISFRLRSSGVRISEFHLKRKLAEMVEEKLIEVKKVDYTEKLIRELLRLEECAPCPSCSHRTFALLYFQVSGVAASSGEKSNVHKKMGHYCVNCGRAEMDTEAVWPKDAKESTVSLRV
jgi:hypothetical protein